MCVCKCVCVYWIPTAKSFVHVDPQWAKSAFVLDWKRPLVTYKDFVSKKYWKDVRSLKRARNYGKIMRDMRECVFIMSLGLGPKHLK